VVNGCVGIQRVVFAGLELTDLKQAKGPVLQATDSVHDGSVDTSNKQRMMRCLRLWAAGLYQNQRVSFGASGREA
jgi:hypothetical protein